MGVMGGCQNQLLRRRAEGEVGPVGEAALSGAHSFLLFVSGLHWCLQGK